MGSQQTSLEHWLETSWMKEQIGWKWSEKHPPLPPQLITLALFSFHFSLCNTWSSRHNCKTFAEIKHSDFAVLLCRIIGYINSLAGQLTHHFLNVYGMLSMCQALSPQCTEGIRAWTTFTLGIRQVSQHLVRIFQSPWHWLERSFLYIISFNPYATLKC